MVEKFKQLAVQHGNLQEKMKKVGEEMKAILVERKKVKISSTTNLDEVGDNYVLGDYFVSVWYWRDRKEGKKLRCDFTVDKINDF